MTNFNIDGHSFTANRPSTALYLVATPIGNLADISIRALRILAGVDVIACEDTRTSGKLLKHYGISTPMQAYHEHNSAQAGPKLIEMLNAGKSIALVSDAGTPLISDPGYKLVKSAQEAQISIYPIPGASALLAGLVGSGLETDQFFFGGFLPSKQTARKKMLSAHARFAHTLIYYESPNRIHRAIEDMIEIFGPARRAAICREITKLHEQYYSGGLGEIYETIEDKKLRGEIVVVVGGNEEDSELDIDVVLKKLLTQMSVSRASSEAVSLTGYPKREIYQRALQLEKEAEDGQQ